MLIGTILFVTVIILAVLWYSESGEQRRRKKEMSRIASRLERQRLDALKEGEDVDVTILWGDIVTILDSLQIASKHSEGVQGLKDLALLIDNKNLIIKKQGQYIRINDIEHLQTLVDTYDSQIKCHKYLNDSKLDIEYSKSAQNISNAQYDSKKDAYLAFAKIVSKNSDDVFDEISLYFDYPEKYFDKFYFDLSQRGIDKIVDLPEVVVLVDALARQNKLVYQDWKTELYHSLEMLDLIVDKELSKNSRFVDLIKQAKISLIGVSILEDKQGEAVFEAIKNSGYTLLSIDENSDSFALFLIPVNELDGIIKLKDLADIKLLFIDRA